MVFTEMMVPGICGFLGGRHDTGWSFTEGN